MEVAILGTGEVGKSLAAEFKKHGPLGMLWVVVGFKLNRWEQAWKLLHK